MLKTGGVVVPGGGRTKSGGGGLAVVGGGGFRWLPIQGMELFVFLGLNAFLVGCLLTQASPYFKPTWMEATFRRGG